MIWLAVAALIVGCVYLNSRHNRRIVRLDRRHVREIRLPHAILESKRVLTPAQAEAIKQAWLKAYAKSTGGAA